MPARAETIKTNDWILLGVDPTGANHTEPNHGLAVEDRLLFEVDRCVNCTHSRSHVREQVTVVGCIVTGYSVGRETVYFNMQDTRQT